MRHTAHKWNLQRGESAQRRIDRLALTGTGEQSESGVVSQAVIHDEPRSDPPGILGVDTEALHILREAAVACGCDGASCGVIRGELGKISEIKSRIFGEG